MTAPVLASVTPHSQRGGLCIQLPAGQLCQSPTWDLGGFHIQFFGLPRGERVAIDQSAGRVFLKVVTGVVNCGETRHVFPAVGELLCAATAATEVTAEQDAVLCVITESAKAPEVVATMGQLSVRGPQAESLLWQSFEDKFGGFTNVFDGLDAHMVPGFHLRDGDDKEIAYVHFWTTGKGVDVTTHNHGQDPSELSPAFAEIHLVLRNGTGTGGMYRCESQQASTREALPMQPGEEHGPFFYFDSNTGAPRLRDNGAVDYPWHGWCGGHDDLPGQAYDLVAAFEINPDKVRI